MRGRRLWWVLALAALAVAGAGRYVLWRHEDRIREANLERITEGMSRAEVEAILGPAGDYSSGPLQFASYTLNAFADGSPHLASDFVLRCYRNPYTDADGTLERFEWRSDVQVIYVYFRCPSGGADTKSCHDVARVEQTALENLLWRAKRQWRRWFP